MPDALSSHLICRSRARAFIKQNAKGASFVTACAYWNSNTVLPCSPGLPVHPSGDVDLGVQFGAGSSPGEAPAAAPQPGNAQLVAAPQPGTSQPGVAPSPLQVTASALMRRGVAVTRRRLLQYGVGLTDLLNAIFPEAGSTCTHISDPSHWHPYHPLPCCRIMKFELIRAIPPTGTHSAPVLK